MGNPVNAALLARLPALGLGDCWLVAGCLVQAVWNQSFGRPASVGLKDYDIFYFDPADLSWAAEDRAIGRVRAALADLDIAIDLKNQARVHLWYQERFGTPYPHLRAATDGIDRFPVAGTCIGLAPCTGNGLHLYAPFGLDDCFAGRPRPNPLSARDPASFLAKAESYRARWPHLITDRRPAPPPQRSRQITLTWPA